MSDEPANAPKIMQADPAEKSVTSSESEEGKEKIEQKHGQVMPKLQDKDQKTYD